MPTIKELEERVARATKLLASKLPPGHRFKLAKLRLLDQTGIAIRKKYPELDTPDESVPKL